METQILANVNPVYEDIYRDAFADNKLNIYTKEFNVDGWIRSLDIFLVYDREEELELAEKVIDDLDLESGIVEEDEEDEEDEEIEETGETGEDEDAPEDPF